MKKLITLILLLILHYQVTSENLLEAKNYVRILNDTTVSQILKTDTALENLIVKIDSLSSKSNVRVSCYTSEEERYIVKALVELKILRKQIVVKDNRIRQRDVKIRFLESANRNIVIENTNLKHSLNEKTLAQQEERKNNWLYFAGGAIGGMLLYAIIVNN